MDVNVVRNGKPKTYLYTTDQVLDQVSDAIISTNLDGIIQTWNAAAERIYGYTDSEAVGEHVGLLYFPEDLQRLDEDVIAPLQSSGTHDTVARTRKKTGEPIFVALRLSLLRDEAGTPVGMLGSSNDITQQKLAEDRLRESETRYRILVETIPHGVEEIDTSGTITVANSAHHRQYGYDDGELIGKSIFDLVATDAERVKLRDHLTYLAKEQPPPEPYFGQKRTKGGRVIDAQVAWDYKRDKQGQVTGFTTVITDITERKRAEKALRQANQELERRVEKRTSKLAKAVDALKSEIETSERVRQDLSESERVAQAQLAEIDQLYRTAPVGLCLMDRDLRFVRINQQLADINGKPIAEHIGKKLHEVIPDIAKIVEAPYRKVLESGEPIIDSEVNSPLPAQPEVSRSWLVSYYPLKSDDGQVVGVNTVVLDITERKLAEEKIRTSQKTLQDAQKIAHLGSFEWQIQEDKLSWSDELYRIYDVDPDEFEGSAAAFFARVVPEDLEKVKRTLQEAVRNRSSFSLQERIRRSDGSIRILDSLGEVVTADDGTPEKVIGCMPRYHGAPTGRERASTK